MIEARAGDPNFAQVLLLTRTAEPLGQRRYWPIYEAAGAAGLPVGIHAFGYGGRPMTAGGWPSYYIEEMVGHAQCQQAVLTSLVFEGVFERFPKLKVVLVEAGFAWAPALAWRMDGSSRKLRQGSAAPEAAAVGIHPRATSGSPRSRWRSRSRASISPMRSSG